MLGCGDVGTEVARLLVQGSDELAQRVGTKLELVGIAVNDLAKDRGLDLPADVFTDDAMALVTRGDIDLVIEVMGTIEPARSYILAALAQGASVVTANKALIAEDGATLFEAAAKAQRDIAFEAAVAAAIPIVRPLRDSLVGDDVQRVLGIVNGTTNYILDTMSTTGADFDDTLAAAQQLGLAETDPTADIEGIDAANKAAILAGLAFHTRVVLSDVYCEGITSISAADMQLARDAECEIKLLAICEKVDTPDGPAVSARVHPALIPRSHPLASVRGAFNAVFVESAAAGQLMFYGAGAGGRPTASAILGDLVSVARNRARGIAGPGESVHADLPVLGIGQARTRYLVSMNVEDRSGVLSAVAQAFAENDVSIKTVRQEGHGSDAQLVIVTHEAEDAALQATVDALRESDMVHDVNSVMRVEGMS